MIYTPKIQKAINFAINVHLEQTRKGKTTPYIVHPLGVGLILSLVTDDENIISAGILHDTIEDSDPPGTVTREIIEKEFGSEVAEMVDDVTEQDKSLPWEERKKLALEHIPSMNKNSLLVKSADVLNNMSDQIEDYKKEGDQMFERFNAGKDQQATRYQNLFLALKKAEPANPLLPDLESQLSILLKLW